jgi:T4 RnlA family RNA ligase
MTYTIQDIRNQNLAVAGSNAYGKVTPASDRDLRGMYKLTYEDAELLCKVYKDFNFYKTMHMFGKYKVVTFNYFLCEYFHFNNPVFDRPDIKGYDMRGVTFVFNEDGTLYRKFLMLPKFFNVNQVEETQMDKIYKKKIKSITSKEDGSLIAYMNLPNGEIFAKTQAGFTNDQSVAAMQLYHTQKDVKTFVDKSLLADCTPLFEYVSYDNRIVLKYDKKEVRLIGIRENDTHLYHSVSTMSKLHDVYDIPVVKTLPIMDFHELETMMNNSEDIEGVVVEFEDGQLVKWKTTWYFNLHGIRTVNIFREDFVIEATSRTALRKGDWLMIPPYKGPATEKNVNIEMVHHLTSRHHRHL